MTVDLSKAVKGSKVYFRCGGCAEIEDVFPAINSFLIGGLCIGYTSIGGVSDGKISGEIKEGPFDIIRIEPPAFDWKDVKPGMAFLNAKGFVRIFECWSVFPNGLGQKIAICTATQKYNDQIAEREHPSDLTRAPEHDIEVAV